MSDQTEDEDVELVPVPMSPGTIAALKYIAGKVGEPPLIAAGMLFEKLLEDPEFWDSFEDQTGVEPQIVN